MLNEWYKFFKENPSFGPILGLALIAFLFFAPIHPQICPIGPYQETEPCIRENLICWLFDELTIHSDFLGALATGVIAWFTWTLKNASLQQGEILGRQTGIIERQLLIQGPFLKYDIYALNIRLDKIDKSIVENYRVHLIWRNSGKDLATNVKYTMGHSIQPQAGDAAEFRREAFKLFGNTIFRYDSLDDGVSLAPDGTVETDQIILSIDELRDLYKKNTQFLIWCVVAYGSRIQTKNWFAEVAIWLEFVLESDPDTFRPGSDTKQSLPFRVAVVGHRYRESRGEDD